MSHEMLTETAAEETSPPAVTEFDGPQNLSAAVALMRHNMAAPHTVSGLAKLVGMSRSNFAGSFRICYGRSPMEFLRAIRLDHAADFLRTTSLAIKVVGARVGYDSRTSFAHAFRRAFGMSPADYRVSHAGVSPTDIHDVSERLRTLRGTSQDLAWEVELASGAVWWSKGTFAALGYAAPKRLVSDVARFFQRIHPSDRDRVVSSVRSACGGDKLTWEDQFRFTRADGMYVRIANGCVILRDKDGSAARLIGVMQVLDK